VTVAPGIARAAAALVVLALVGACLFGLWHVVVGGLVNGNSRAATFGVGLAAASGTALVLAWFARRRTGRA
jgi:hypothetical protein